jgi:hypothetical protein
VPMRMLSRRVINAEIMRGMEKNPRHWSLNLVDQHVPPFLRRFGRQLACVPGSQFYRFFQRGELSYQMYYFAKA